MSFSIRLKKAGKVPASYEIPEKFRNNTPEKLEQTLSAAREKGFFPVFPYGTSFKPDEIVLGKALRTFKAAAEESKFGVMKGVLGSWFSTPSEESVPYLKRMNLDKPEGIKEKLMQKIVVHALKMTDAI